MEWAAFILSIAALGISLLVLRRTGGIGEMKKEMDSLSSLGESLRKKTADILDRLEKRVRGEEKLTVKEDGGEPSKTEEDRSAVQKVGEKPHENH